MLNPNVPETVSVQGVAVPVVEYQGQRVITFAMIDNVHGRPIGTARKRFNDNSDRFIENEDFYVIDSSSMSVFRTHGIFGESAQHGVVLTESGYLMLVKSFTDDLAWEVQRTLVKAYFRVRAAEPDYHTMLSDPGQLRHILLLYTEKVIALEATIQEQAPKVEFHDAVASAENCQSVRDAAKVLGTGEKRLFQFLRAQGLLMSNNVPYQRYVEAGYFRVVERVHDRRGRGFKELYTKTLITGKGITYLQKQLANH